MSRAHIHESVQLAWAIANTEACLSGRGRIEPVHFLLASFMILDGLFEDAADALELTKESVNRVFKVADRCRVLLGMTDEEVTSARRGLRKVLRKDAEPTELCMLHRSPESRFIFQRAGRRALNEGASEVTLAHLFAEILDNLPEEAKPFFKGQRTSSHGDSDEWPDYIPNPFKP